MHLENYCQLYRNKARLRQYDMALALGTTQQKISLWETDPLRTDLGKLLAYADVLEIPLVALLPRLAHVHHPQTMEAACASPIPIVSNVTRP